MLVENAVMVLPPQERNNKCALWSGGLMMSKRARDDGFVTLESCPLGSVFDGICGRNLIWPNWGSQTALWEVLSTAYVRSVAEYGASQIHVYIRTYDASAILIREEQRAWRAAKGTRSADAIMLPSGSTRTNSVEAIRAYHQEVDGMQWHVFLGPDDFLEKVNEKPFNNAWEAFNVLLKTLQRKRKGFFKSELRQKVEAFGLRGTEESEERGAELPDPSAWKNYEISFKTTFARLALDYGESAADEFAKMMRDAWR